MHHLPCCGNGNCGYYQPLKAFGTNCTNCFVCPCKLKAYINLHFKFLRIIVLPFPSWKFSARRIRRPSSSQLTSQSIRGLCHADKIWKLFLSINKSTCPCSRSCKHVHRHGRSCSAFLLVHGAHNRAILFPQNCYLIWK